MRKLLAIAWTDIRIEFSERSTLLFFLALPLVFTAILGSAMGGPDPEADNRIPVLLVNEDAGFLAGSFTALLADSDAIRPTLREREEAERLFDEAEAVAMLIIPEGFSRQLLAGQEAALILRAAVNDNRTLAVEQAVNAASSQIGGAVAAALASVAAAEEIGPFADDADRQDYFEESLLLAQSRLQEPPARLEVERAASSPSNQMIGGFQQASAGQLVTWVLITLIGASGVFVNERLGGTLRRLLTTPTRRITIMAGKIGGRYLMGLVQMALLIGAGALLFGVEWGRSPAALIILVLAFGLAAVSFGILLGALARTRSQASGLTTLSAMLMAALGGAWWPLEITPPAYQQVVQILPTTWAMKGFTAVIVRGQSAVEILPVAGILLLFALVFLAIGLWRFRYE